MLRRLVGGTTVSRAPEGCVGPGRPIGVGRVSLILKLDGQTLRWTPTHTHENACTTHPGSLVVGPATQAHPTYVYAVSCLHIRYSVESMYVREATYSTERVTGS